MLTDLIHRLRAVLRRRTIERELDEELQFHLEEEIRKRVASGMPLAEAVRQARLAFGGVEQVKEACRDARGVRPVETTIQDLRYGLRTLRRAPIFALTAAGTIALSTAALATVFAIRHTLFVRPLPVERPEELVIVSATRGRTNGEGLVSYPDYTAFRDRTKTLASLAAHYSTAPLFVAANGNAKELNGAVVTANFFSVLHVEPALGRFFTAEEDRVPDRDRVAVISDHLWRTWFGASPLVQGATLRINGVDFTIVGVAPATFAGVTTAPAEIFIPAMMLGVGYRWCEHSLARDCTILEMIGRLAPGRTLAEASAELPTLMPASWAGAPVGENSGVRVSQPRGTTTDPAQSRLVGILVGVAVVLLLVCSANLTGLLGAQSAARANEFSIRLSLGASAGRVIRQVFTESLLLAVAGAIAGVLLSHVFIAALQAMFFTIDGEGHPLLYDFSLSAGVVGLAIAAALVAGCLFSIVPAYRAVRRDVASLNARTASVRWSSGACLLGVQAAVAVALIAIAGLLAWSARSMMTGTRFEASHIALMRVRPRLVKYPPERAQRFQREVVSRLSVMPGVESVSMVGIGAVLGGGDADVALPGWAPDQHAESGYNEIGPGYFDTLRTPMLAGREFDDHDTLSSARVAIVNETLARRLWPDGGAIGATMLIKHTPHQVVGLVSDVPLNRRTEASQPYAYTPFWQNVGQIDSRLCIRVSGDPAAMLAPLAREVNRIDPDVPIAETITLPVQMAGWIRPLRLAATFIGYGAALTLLLTAIGLYGTLSFAVARRTREIGIRMALGASGSRVLGLIVREGMSLVATGAVVGVALAAAGSRFVAHLLYGAASADWLYFLAGAAVISLVGLAATVVPARRAAAIEPLVALRHE